MKIYIFLLIPLFISCTTKYKNSENSESISSKINLDSSKQESIKNKDTILQIFRDDTLPRMYHFANEMPVSENERKALRILWNTNKIRVAANDLAKKNIKVYCYRDVVDSIYEYGVYQDLSDHEFRMFTFRIDKDLKNAEYC